VILRCISSSKIWSVFFSPLKRLWLAVIQTLNKLNYVLLIDWLLRQYFMWTKPRSRSIESACFRIHRIEINKSYHHHIILALANNNRRLIYQYYQNHMTPLCRTDTKCLPVLVYGLEVCPLSKSDLQSLDFVVNRFGS